MSADKGTGTMGSRSRRHGEAQSPSKVPETQARSHVRIALPVLPGAVALRGVGLSLGEPFPGSGRGSSSFASAATQHSIADISSRSLPSFITPALASARRFVDAKYSKTGSGTNTPLPPGMEE